MNQVELHPCLPQHDLLSFCNTHGIILTAYSPVGKHKFADNPLIGKIAEAHGSTSAQVLLSWGLQRGTAVIPKTVREERLRENLEVLVILSPQLIVLTQRCSEETLHLTAAEMLSLDKLHLEPGMHHSVCGFHSPELGGSCFGWTYEQLGWDLIAGGVHV